MELSKAQSSQLNDIVRETRITRGKNTGSRKDQCMCVEHFDMRSFNRLIEQKLVAPSEYKQNEWFATELGFNVWQKLKEQK